MKKPATSLGPVLIGIDGTTLDETSRQALLHPWVGGVVLFSRNFVDRVRLGALTNEIRALRTPRLLIAVDQEGGRVQRFQEGFTRLPSLGQVGATFEAAPERSRELAYRHGWLMATEVLDVGIDLSFAPVLDLDRGSDVIGDRSFGRFPQAVCELGHRYLQGMHDAGMCATGKHFPGHGSVRADSHVDDVRDSRPLAEIESLDLLPYQALCSHLDAVMMAHVCYTQVDRRPAGYSRVWLSECLRSQLGFKGVVFSDDIGMHAAKVAGSCADRASAALAAGCEAVLACHPADVDELLGSANMPQVPGFSPRLQSLYGKPGAPAASIGAGIHPDREKIRAWSAQLEALASNQEQEDFI